MDQQAAMIDCDEVDLDDIQELGSFLRRYPDIANEPRARWWIYQRKINGLESSGAVIKRSGRWFVVVPRLRDWLLRTRP